MVVGLIEDDGTWARLYCASAGLRYLSHETYKTGASHEVWIAVEDATGKYEIRLKRPQ